MLVQNPAMWRFVAATCLLQLFGWGAVAYASNQQAARPEKSSDPQLEQRRQALCEKLAAATTTRDKIKLLSRFEEIYVDAQLPDEAAYLLALKLLTPHLGWHAAYPPPPRPDDDGAAVAEQIEMVESHVAYSRHQWRWSEAHPGESWMLRNVPKAELRKARKLATERAAANRKRGSSEAIEPSDHAENDESWEVTYFWCVDAPDHPDVARAKKLLGNVTDKAWRTKAARWIHDIGRNNTVVTMDVVGAYESSKSGPVVVDVRNADRLELKLYRAGDAANLLAVHDRVGEDFVYRDYDLQLDETVRRLIDRVRSLAIQEELMVYEDQNRLRRKVVLKPEHLVRQWQVEVATLPALDLAREETRFQGDRDWDEYLPDGDYFGDDCSPHRSRLKKKYWPGWERMSSWQCDRLLKIPAEAIRDPGGYVLVAEANGQTFYAPIIVDPLSLLMRRCRDGVFALVSDTHGESPVPGATLTASDAIKSEITDSSGVTFLKVFAAGDRAIVASKGGRFAVGGFGRLFHGIYHSDLDDRWVGERMRRMRVARLAVAREAMGHAYTDRYLAAAYTDRPTYRPGQEVQFKLILRRLPAAQGDEQDSADGKSERGSSAKFRAADFDWEERLEPPPDGNEVHYDVLDSRGRLVAGGDLELNDFGTGAGEFDLSAEARHGTYSLRVHAGGMDRIVPQVFAVKHYRRPNFELEIAGLPDAVKPGQAVRLEFSGKYYFGKPLTGGQCLVQFVAPRGLRPLADGGTELEANGTASIQLDLPKDLPGGEYRLIGSLTDLSGRAVTRTLACRVDAPAHSASSELAALVPRFVPVGESFEIRIAGEVVAEQSVDAKRERVVARAVAGAAKISLPSPGWWRLRAGNEKADVFAYGGPASPYVLPQPPQEDTSAENDPRNAMFPRWVNLTDYEAEEDGWQDFEYHWFERGRELLALMERQHARVGERLPVLVYMPAGGGRVLLTVEGRTVIDYLAFDEPTRAEGCYHVIEVSIARRYLPNFYLQGRIVGSPRFEPAYVLPHRVLREVEQREDIDDETDDPRWCRVDVIDPHARPGRDKLDVRIETDAEVYRPGDQVAARVTVTNLKGKPQPAEVSLAVVDQGVFSFGEDRVDWLPAFFSDPHPPRRYLRKAWRDGPGLQRLIQSRQADRILVEIEHAARQVEQMAEALQQLAKSRDELASGYPPPTTTPFSVAYAKGMLPATQVPLARLRDDFRETAAWLPQLRTDPRGVAETSFTLPDSLTRYRLTGVGLTRDTKLGVGRGEIRTTLPLSVQLMLPRFAVEGDRLLAVGLIHNNTDQAKKCDVVWDVDGARLQPPDGAKWMGEDVPQSARHGEQVEVSANGSRVSLPLGFAAFGDAKVSLRAGDGHHSDGETRALAVKPRGRPREIALTGGFSGEKSIDLPAGFVARDLRLSIAQSDLANSMEGLAYLIDYPYGCVEQTMSRFLPAVTVKRAVQNTPVDLPPEVSAKLPDVLSRGLQRLYNFQHADGGWGWWEEDATNDGMTIYVVYGLARCRDTGTQVDDEVLKRGTAYLHARLESGKMETALRPRAWLALALAGEADLSRLHTEAQGFFRGTRPEIEKVYLALACIVAEIDPNREIERFVENLEKWKPETVEGLSVKLILQVAIPDSISACRETSAELLARRKGQRWGSTRDTSWAIEALSQMLNYDTRPPKNEGLKVTITGKTVLEMDASELANNPVARLHVEHGDIPRRSTAPGKSTPIRIELMGDEPVRYALAVTGIQRLDRTGPEGDKIRLLRSFETPRGEPFSGPAKVGDVIAVRLRLELESREDYLIVDQPRPAGLEFADEILAGGAASRVAHREFRDNGLAVFFTALPAGQHELVFYLRAETPGTSHFLPGECYPMYREEVRGSTGADKVEVRKEIVGK